MKSPGIPELSSVPILHIFAFLDWEQRIALANVFEGGDFAESEGRVAIPCAWFFERLLEESYIVAFPSATVVDLLFCICIRRTINGVNDVESPYPRITTASLMLCSEGVSDYQGMVFSDFSVGDFPLLTRFGLPPRRGSSVRLEMGSGEISVRRGVSFSKKFECNAICQDQLRLDAIEFVNGRNLCYILTGCVDSAMDNACGSLLNELASQMETLINFRSKQLPQNVYSCRVSVSISCLSKTEKRLLYGSKNLAGLSGHLSAALVHRFSGHVCLEINLLHEFSRPCNGRHSNKFIVCIPSTVDRSRSGLNLDTFALRKCLQAIKLNRTFIPTKESKLTQYLSLLSDHQIRIVAVVSNADENKTKASVAGLRFAELN